MSDYNGHDNETPVPEQQNNTGQKPAAEPGKQYWSGQDARRAHGEGNIYYGHLNNGQQSGYQQPYDPYRQNQNSNQPPWQYNPDGGWQQSGYQWNFEDYDKLGQGGPGGPKKKNRGLVILAVALLCVLSLALVGLSVASLVISDTDVGSLNAARDDLLGVEDREDTREEDRPRVSEPAAQMELSSRPQVDDEPLPEGRLTIPQVAQKLLPSVVSVEIYINSQFYEAVGLGSGIIMNDQGYIVTNAHVVEGADAIKVTLENGDPYEARLIGADSRTDLAVIHIDAPDLVPAEFGDSGELLVGETVVAIGNPASLQFAGSVTQGIISALNRTVNTGTYSMTYIQTDAAINPGNSGGALANEFGQVIGINSNKIAAEGFEGMGFAIPISDAKPIIDDLIANGRVTGRVMLGITAVAVDEVDAKRYNVPMGLQIVNIDAASDLGRKGVQSRDIITHINGVRIYTHDDLRAELDEFRVGQTVQLTLYRQSSLTQGTTFDVSITLLEDGA